MSALGLNKVELKAGDIAFVRAVDAGEAQGNFNKPVEASVVPSWQLYIAILFVFLVGLVCGVFFMKMKTPSSYDSA